MSIILNFIYLLAFLLLAPKMLYRMLTQNRYKIGWAHRLGNLKRTRTSNKTIWIHAVSVGEVNATRTIITELQNKCPDLDIILTTTTDTGFAQANRLYKDNLDIFFFPMDFSFVMKKAFTSLNPAICLLMELEVWPNFAIQANKANVPIVVVNGRISERSFPRYKLIKNLSKWMFNKITLFLVQSDEYSERFIQLGVEKNKLIKTGTLKYDTAQLTDQIEGKEELKQKLDLEDEPLWVAGGTGPGEEEIILDVYQKLIENPEIKNLRLAIVPRKPERFNEVARLIEEKQFNIVRYSSLKQSNNKIANKESVILGDTMGDLRKFYSLAKTIFVGRSLVPMGGSDMMEAAAMKKFTSFGPHTFNFNQTVDKLLEAEGAVQIETPSDLYETVLKSLIDHKYSTTIAQNGQNLIRDNQGATNKSVDQILNLLAGIDK